MANPYVIRFRTSTAPKPCAEREGRAIEVKYSVSKDIEVMHVGAGSGNGRPTLIVNTISPASALGLFAADAFPFILQSGEGRQIKLEKSPPHPIQASFEIAVAQENGPGGRRCEPPYLSDTDMTIAC